MKSFIRNTINFILGNAFIFFFFGLIFLHMLLLGSHLQIYNAEKMKERQQIYHDILFFMTADPKKLPTDQLNRMIKTLNKNSLRVGDSHVILFLTDQPLFETQWNPTLDKKQLYKQKIQNTFSFQVKKNIWLNGKIAPNSTLYETLVYLACLDFLILGLYLFYVFSLHRFEAPLHSLKESADRLGIDLNAAPEKTFGPPIVREAAMAITQLQTRLRDLISSRTQMLASVSHDLRTYITRLKLRIHLLPPSERIEKIYDDLTDMETMIEDILNFAGEDAYKEKKSIFDIVVLLFSVCEDLMDQGSAVHIQSNCYHRIFFGCRIAIKRMFINLIQNALKYATEVWVSVHCHEKNIQIIIEDNGPGIPEVELQQVFMPFFRSSQIQERHVGFGLGLTIANDIIRLHSGKITLTNREPKGLRVCITFLHPELSESMLESSPKVLSEP